MTNATNATKVTKVTMGAIKVALPAYFTANLPGLVTAMGNSKANVTNLALALTGAALEVGQSGNRPASWMVTDSEAQKLKGAAKERVNSALSLVMAVGNASLKGHTIEQYTGEASAIYAKLVETLTPPAPAAKPEGQESTSAKVKRLEAEVTTLTIENAQLTARIAELEKEKATA